MSDIGLRLATALAGRYAVERELGHGGMATEGGHDVPRTDLIRESLAWLDKYLGPVK